MSQFNSNGISTTPIHAISPSGSIVFFPSGLYSSSLLVTGSDYEYQIEASSSFVLESSTLGKHFQIRMPSASLNASQDVIPFFITSSGQRPLVGVGTTDPKTSFDIKEQLDNGIGVEFLLRNSRTVIKGADPGDAAGTINFIIDSGSYNNIQTSGSIAKITSEVLNVTDEGAIGDLLFQTAQSEKEEPITTMRIGRNGSSLTSSLDVSLFLKAQKIALGTVYEGNVSSGGIGMSGDLNVLGNTSLGNQSSDTHEFNGSITASNDISASGDITGSDVYINDWGSVSASLAAASGTSGTNKSQYLYTYNYTTSTTPTPGSGNLTVSNNVVDWIVVNTSSLNNVDLDGSSVGSSFSDFLFNKVGSIITLKETGSGAFASWSVLNIILGSNGASAGSDPDSVAFQIDFPKDNSSGSLSDGDIVEFIWDQSAAVGDLTESTLFSAANPTYNVIDTFFGTNNLFTPALNSTLSLSYTGSGYIATAISKSSDLTLGGLTVNGDVTTTGALEIGGISNVSASIATAIAGGGGGATTYRTVIESSCLLAQTALRYLPFNSLSEQTSFNYLSITPAAADGKVVSITMWPQSSGGSTVVGLHINSNATAATTDTQTISAGTPLTFTFSSGNTFSQNDELSFSVASTSNINGLASQIVLEYDL